MVSDGEESMVWRFAVCVPNAGEAERHKCLINDENGAGGIEDQPNIHLRLVPEEASKKKTKHLFHEPNVSVFVCVMCLRQFELISPLISVQTTFSLSRLLVGFSGNKTCFQGQKGKNLFSPTLQPS